MQKTLLFSTKAKILFASILLMAIMSLAAWHIYKEQQKLLSSLIYIDNLRQKNEPLKSAAEEIDELVIAISKNIMSPDLIPKRNIERRIDDIIEQISNLKNMESSTIPSVIENIKEVKKLYQLQSPTVINQKKAFFYTLKANEGLHEQSERINLEIEDARQKTHNLMEQNPYDTLWIIMASISLILALGVVMTTEIFMPMQLITSRLLGASNDTEHTLDYLIKNPRNDEAGIAQQALNKLLTGVDQNIRHILEAAQKDSKQLSVIEAMKDGIGMSDARGNLTFANKSLLRIYGIPESERSHYIGKPWKNILGQTKNDEIEEIILPALKEKRAWDGEVTITRRDGEQRIIETSVFLLEDNSMIGTVRDISRRRAAEKERQELQELFAQSQKMEAVGRLTGGVAHDFNNILTIIGGNLDLLKDDVTGTAEKYIATAERALKRGAELTQRLLSFSRKQVLLPKVININTLLPETMTLINRAINDDIDLSFNMQQDLWQTQIDTGQMENAILNLVINARDAMPDGGTITITTENIWLGGQKMNGLFSTKAGPYVKVSVRDTGTGMPPEIVQKVFEPFFTTKTEGKGTGLGLSMVYGFVKQSGGYVFIESKEKEFTSIDMYFPRYEGEETEALCVETVHTQLHSEDKETILLAEDEEDLRDLAINMLSRLGYKVTGAVNGAEAYKILQSGEKFDILITDMMMPQMNGRDLAQKARALQPDLNIVMVSGYDDAHDNGTPVVENARFLTKPYTQAQLAGEIRNLLDKKLNKKKGRK